MGNIQGWWKRKITRKYSLKKLKKQKSKTLKTEALIRAQLKVTQNLYRIDSFIGKYMGKS